MTKISTSNLQKLPEDNANNIARERTTADVLFPDEIEDDSSHYDDYNQVPDISIIGSVPQCQQKGETYCEKDDQYPAALITKLMNQTENQQLLNESVAENSLRISSRIQNREKVRFCKSRTVVIYPKLAIATDNHWRHIINQDQNLQAIKVELCEHTNECAFAKNFPNGKVTQYEQMHHEQLLLSIRNGKVVQNRFQMPSHCECTWIDYGRVQDGIYV